MDQEPQLGNKETGVKKWFIDLKARLPQIRSKNTQEKEIVKTQPAPQGLYSETGGLILETIPENIIQNLKSIDPRLSFVGIQAPVDETLLSNLDSKIVLSRDYEQAFAIINNFGVDGNSFVDYVIPSLVADLDRVLTKSGKDRIGLRGTACSIEGKISEPAAPPKTYRVNLSDIREIMKLGKEQTGDETLVSTYHKNNPGQEPEIHHRTVQWLVDHPKTARKDLVANSDIARKVYPLLLVYDLDKLQPGKTLYSAQLKPGISSWSDALLKAYILPCPTGYQSPHKARIGR